jgi:hypothetical protein
VADFEIRGVEQLAALSKRLKAIGDKELTREFSRSVTAAMKPLMQELRSSARSTLPSSGGLADKVARSKIRTVRRASSGVRVTANNPYGIKQMDEGRVRHPVFGNRSNWAVQSVRPGWWTRPTEKVGPEVRQALQEAMEAIARKVG